VSEERLIDARGLLCPWPALRIAPAEIRKLCEERGWRCASDAADPAAFRISFD
jgi:hypothetical protein